MMNHIWSLFARSGSLSVAWMENTWLKGRRFWQVPIPQNCSWSWKKLFQLRDAAKKFLSFKVGDGSKIFLWYDIWHLKGSLMEKYGFRTVYDAGCSIGPKLYSIIRNGEWFWPSARSESLVEIQSRLPEVDIGDRDIPIWKSSKGVYSCAETWEQLRIKLPVIEWYNMVWYPLAIPRQPFILWLVCRDALRTKDRMCCWGFDGPMDCLFCHT
jgi:hypothetical protein